MRTYARPSPPAAVLFNDVNRFSAATNTWTALFPSGSGPSPRNAMGFAATPDSRLYVFGGYSGTGGSGGGGIQGWGGLGLSLSVSLSISSSLSLSLQKSMRVRREAMSHDSLLI
jgi:hypothetical protein